MRDEYSLDIGHLLELCSNGFEIGCLSPLGLYSRHLEAEQLGNLGEPVAEDSNRDREHCVTWREAIDDGCFHGASSGRRVSQHGLCGLEEMLQLGGNSLE